MSVIIDPADAKTGNGGDTLLWFILAPFFALVLVTSETALMGNQDRDSLLAFSYLPTQLLPLAVAGHTSRVRTLGEDQTR